MGPSRLAAALVGFFLPPACREEVLGDLHERYRSGPQYFWDALCAVPMVILSRVRRTSDLRVVFSQALGLYVSFIGAARLTDPALLLDWPGMLPLLRPILSTLVVLALCDAYADPKRPSPFRAFRAPLIAIALSFAVELSIRQLPFATMSYGFGIALLFTTGIRLLFPPIPDQMRLANAPADWLKLSGMAPVQLGRLLRAVAPILTILIAAILLFRLWLR